MKLRNIAAKRITERMEAWDPSTGSFVPDSFLGRISLTDRFLSNFNKPLRRRMLFTRFGTQLPASRTFRHPGTGDVYLIGQGRSDGQGREPYLSLNVCHLVTDAGPGGSAGLATLYRRAPAGPADDPGWLVETEVAKAYVDLEFRTSANEAGTTDVKVENFFAFFPSWVLAEEWDFVELHGKRYRVVDTFPDSGLSGLRVDEEPDPRVDLKLHVLGERVYDHTTHAYTSNERTYHFTGMVPNAHDFATWADESEPYVDVVVDREHIGLAPPAGRCWVEYAGRRRAVKTVGTQLGERQYRMRCY